jgi:hypothetical protein
MMISDVLFNAVSDLDHYLDDPTYTRAVYPGPLLEQIRALRDQIEAMRMALDTLEGPGEVR